MPADLKYFKAVTSEHTVIMGRKTFDSIGKALPKRRNIVITRQENFNAPGCEVMSNLQEAIDACLDEEEVFVVGGAQIYRQALPVADKLYLTRIDHEFEGDTRFPDFSLTDWKLVTLLRNHKDEKNPYDYSFAEYERQF